MAEEQEQKLKVSLKVPKINVWMVSTIILAFAIIVVWFFKPSTIGFTVLPSDEASKKAIDYINRNLVQAGTNASLISVKDMGTFYEVMTSYRGNQIPVYVSKDGKYLWGGGISVPINMDEPIEIPKTEEQPSTQEFDAPDREKPDVKLFVMSFCPFGVQAENLMKPVVDLLGTRADIKIHFIVDVHGNTTDSIGSLHGINEAKEDARQACIMKYYTQKTFWNYLMEINKNCYPVYRDAEKLEECWKKAAQNLGIDVDKIEKCAYGSEGIELLKADEELTNQYRVTGSPTLIINGVRYTGSRSSEEFKKAICSGFITQPSECSQNITSTSSSTSSGSCS
ncbi:MAG: DsbA family protein [Candidatus Aenigmatarchaeota archaeon]